MPAECSKLACDEWLNKHLQIIKANVDTMRVINLLSECWRWDGRRGR